MQRKVNVKIGNKTLGPNSPVLIQSMTTFKTSNYKAVIKEILKAEVYGLDLVRVSIVDEADIKALNKIKEAINIPLVVDLHFNKDFALKTLDQKIDKIRLNPLNIGSVDDFKEIVLKAKSKRIPMRLGFNESNEFNPNKMLELAKKYVEIAEDLGYKKIVLSFKFSDVLKTIYTYKKAYKIFDYPLHVGVTEAGPLEIGLIKSSAALTPLLLDGYCNTIRISLTDSVLNEVKASKRLLKSLNIISDWPELISCPTCGRCEVELLPIAREVLDFIEEKHICKKVAIMGCPVNGPGEAKEADIGIAGNKDNNWTLFKKGQSIRIIPGKNIVKEFRKELLKI